MTNKWEVFHNEICGGYSIHLKGENDKTKYLMITDMPGVRKKFPSKSYGTTVFLGIWNEKKEAQLVCDRINKLEERGKFKTQY